MTGIQWNSRFSPGLEMIDEEHQELFRILNSLVSVIEHYHLSVILLWINTGKNTKIY